MNKDLNEPRNKINEDIDGKSSCHCLDITNPLVSIITVVFNGDKTIEKTIESIKKQSYKNIEYIIIDGNSTDETLSIVEVNKSYIDCLVSETDEGVYDAMNKGIDVAHGEWIMFLGADDELFNEFSIEKLVASTFQENTCFKQNSEQPLLIFGDIIYDNGNYFKSSLNIRTIIRNTIQHQSAIYHKSLFDNFRYNTLLRINSDYELNLLAYVKRLPTKHINSIISTCSYGGLSTDFKNLKLLEVSIFLTG
jgi:putative colanic acid biosynthesis glycosyltransferase